jgi:ketosteroid isomerase-like protein
VASDNVEIVRRIYETFLSRDNVAARALIDPEIEWDMRELEIPGLDNLYRGIDGVTEFWRQWLDAWDQLDLDLAEPIELRDGRVVVVVRGQRNLGRGTGMWVEMPPYEQVWTIRDGKAVSMRLRLFD